jgi:hypothetical protein
MWRGGRRKIAVSCSLSPRVERGLGREAVAYFAKIELLVKSVINTI